MFRANRSSGGVDTGGRGGGRDPDVISPLSTPAPDSGGPAYGPSANPAAGAAGFNNPNAVAPPSWNPATGSFSGAGSSPGSGQLNPGFGGGGYATTASGPNTSSPGEAQGLLSGGSNRLFGNSWSPTMESGLGGYNPSQYASTGTANQLAQALGGNVNQTRNAPGSPIGPPPQAMLDFGANGQLNAGLLAERYAKYDKATADAMTQAELATMGPRQAPNEDSQGGSMGSWSMYGPREGGGSFMGQGQNMGQYIGTNLGGNFGSQPANAGAVRAPQAPQIGGGYQGPAPNYHPHTPAPAPPGSPLHPAPRPQPIGNRMNFGGFGGAQQFGQANQNAGMQQLMQLLMGGQGGILQGRGRSNQFGGGGQMSGLMGMPSFLGRPNQSAGNGFGGPGPARSFGGASPFSRPGNMAGLANFMNSYQPGNNMGGTNPLPPGMMY